ncbi:hypothetical protein L9F63_014302 [Diploptera punctata]|uniref:Mitochondrial inner membrane protein Mpv17 n=1 Tax=Diploptera punctata TaxID=6984 RepID=A0AAD8ELU5_DIPPU|nr:hypothetical protein L9F63_014302 [Diploptera punctata]
MAVGDVTCQLVVDKKTLQTLDGVRVLKFGSIGLFFVGPVLLNWYRFLHRMLKPPYLPLKKVACDQLFCAPLLLFTITSAVSLLENNGIEETKHRLRESYLQILMANYKLWPLVQTVNFSFVPLNYQVLVVQTVAIFWNTYLSYKTHEKII